MYQFVLRQPLGIRGGLQILVGHIQMTVPQVIPNGELMFAHLRQHRSHGVTEGVPAYARDPDLGKRRLYLAL